MSAIGLNVHTTALSTFDFYTQLIDSESKWELWTHLKSLSLFKTDVLNHS